MNGNESITLKNNIKCKTASYCKEVKMNSRLTRMNKTPKYIALILAVSLVALPALSVAQTYIDVAGYKAGEKGRYTIRDSNGEPIGYWDIQNEQCVVGDPEGDAEGDSSSDSTSGNKSKGNSSSTRPTK